MYKLVCFSAYRQAGLEPKKNRNFKNDAVESMAEHGIANGEKAECHIYRTAARIKEFVLCNDWQFWVTLTLDKTKYNRHDLRKFRKDLAQVIRDLRKKYGTDIAYLFIPERHKDGCWHMHGFLSGLPEEELREFSLADHLPHEIRKRLAAGTRVFTWKTYERKFGFADIELLIDKARASTYITKYITKELLRTVTELNDHAFFHSRNLKEREFVAAGDALPFVPDYQGDYCSIKWATTAEELLQYIDTGKENY